MKTTHVKAHTRKVNLNKYMGEWQQAAAKPAPFQTDCKKVTATYKLLKTGKVTVVNKCQKNGETTSIKGTAESTNPTNTKLLIDFGFPYNIFGKGDYNILYTNPQYTRAVVGTQDKKYLWVLTRKTKPTNQELAALKKIAQSKGYTIKDLK